MDQDDLIDVYGLGQCWGIPQDENDYQRASSFEIDKRELMSENDHYKTEVKRKNFITLFLDGYEADKYVATHLYGGMSNLNTDANLDEIDNFFETTALNFSTTFAARTHHAGKSSQNARKMSQVETTVALIKGYCATAVLILPKTY